MINTFQLKTRTPSLASKWAALSFTLFVAFIFISGTKAYADIGFIKQYEHNVFTNQGQSSVKQFQEKLAKAAEALLKVKKLNVYVGYHGDHQGLWCHKDFNKDEKNDVAKLGKNFPNATLIWVGGGNLPPQEIEKAIAVSTKGEAGVFFTWCDSDTYVNTVMGNKMPKLEKEFK